MLPILLVVVFVITIAIGVPIAVSLGLTAATGFIYLGAPIVTITQRIFTGMESFPLMAIPLFILAGNLMTEGGIAKRLMDFVYSITGNIRGSLAISGVIACAIFAALSGSGPATVIAIGSMIYPEAKKLGYPEKSVAGLITISGGLGPIIPPSVIMVVYAVLANASLKELFSAGAFWGILIAFVLILMVIIIAHLNKWPKANKKNTAIGFWKTFFSSIPAFLMPLAILGGIYSGVATPTESAGVAVVIALIVGLFIYKELNLKKIAHVLIGTAKSSAMIMFVIGCASSLSWIFSYADISNNIVDLIRQLNLSDTGFMLATVLLLLFFGMIMDGASIMVIFIPLLYPIANYYGINMTHYGIIFCIMISLGNATPPVGINLFSMRSVSKLSLEEIAKGQMPFLIAKLCIVLLIVFVPKLTMMLL